jgi:hypothetical protein
MPIAVVMTKTDVCGLGKRFGVGEVNLHGRYASMASAASHAEVESEQVRRFLLDAGLGNLVQIFEGRFEKCEFFAVASLCPVSRQKPGGDAFRPRGVMAPFVWLCHETNALSDIDIIEFFFVNSHIFAIRALRGLEGPGVQLASMLTVAGTIAFVLVVALLLYAFEVPPLLVFLAGGFQVGMLAILYLLLAIDWVYRRYP